MRFRVHGRDKESGRHVDVPIFAATREDAVRIAEKQGLEVLSVKVRVRTSSPALQRFGWVVSFGICVLGLIVLGVVVMMLTHEEGLPAPRNIDSESAQVVSVSIPPHAILHHEVQPFDEHTQIQQWIVIKGTYSKRGVSQLLTHQFREIESRSYYRSSPTTNDVLIRVYGSRADYEHSRNCIAELHKELEAVKPKIVFFRLAGTNDEASG